MKNRHVFVRVVTVLVGLLLVLPTLVVIPIGFTGKSTFAFPPETWSLRWYESFFEKPAWLLAFSHSIQIAVLATVVATVLGTAAAIGLHRWRRSRGRELTRTGLLLPMVVPGIVLAIGIYGVYTLTGLNGSLVGFVIAHALLGLPFVVVSVTVSLSTLDGDLERAAAGLGASPFAVLMRVTVPGILPGIITGALFAFVTSFDEVMVALFIKSPFLETLPVRMFTSVSTSIDPTIAAASTIVLVFTSLLLALVGAVFLIRSRITRRRAIPAS